MKIVKSEVTLHRFATQIPASNKPFRETPRLLVKLETDTGVTGIGMAGGRLLDAVGKMVVSSLLPSLAEMDVSRIEAVHKRLINKMFARGGANGIALAGLSAIDMAIWDAMGKTQGRTVAQLLGGARTEAEVYVTYGFPAYDIDQLIEIGRDLRDRGFRTLKVLVGEQGNIAEDARRVREVRKALGDAVGIALDANEKLAFDEALRLGRMLRDVDIAWFEEPIAGGDARQLADLRQMTGIPIAMGQFDGHSLRLRELIEAGAIDIFTPNSMFNGGITETARAGALSQIYNLPLSDAGGGGIFSIQHVCGLRNGTMTEMHLGIAGDEKIFLEDAPEPVNGRLSVPSGAGFGVKFNEAALADTLVRTF